MQLSPNQQYGHTVTICDWIYEKGSCMYMHLILKLSRSITLCMVKIMYQNLPSQKLDDRRYFARNFRALV